MQLGVCLNCQHHEECTFQRAFPVWDCNEYQEMDLSKELDMKLSEVFAQWGFTALSDER